MFVRVISIGLIIGTTSLLGYYLSRLDEYRINDLKIVKKSLTMLCSEIRYASTSLPNALESISTRIEGVISNMYTDISLELKKRKGMQLSEVWNKSLDKYKSKTYLNKEDIDNLMTFGKTLGYLDKDMQQKNIELIIDYLDNQIDQLNDKKNKNSKMYRSLGFLSGLLIVVILL